MYPSTRTLTAAIATVAIGSSSLAGAAVIGSLANFDVVNDTGQKAYGFQIEIDDPSFDHTKLTSVFGYDRNFGLPAGPGAVERYGTPSIQDLPGVGVRIVYGGHVGPTFTPSAPFTTTGDSCWPLAGGWSTATSCDHFGVATLTTPANTKYSWLIESTPGSGVLVARQSGIPDVNFALTPAPAPAIPAVVNAQINAVAPNPDFPEAESLWGEAFWVKSFSAKVGHNVDLGNLFQENADQRNAQVEVEWDVFQKAPAGQVGKNQHKQGKDQQLGAKDLAVIQRYEFYKYLGPVSAEGEADCKKNCDPISHPEYLGAFVGAQMAGFNVNEQAGPLRLVPEPGTYAMMVAGLTAVGVLGLRRRRNLGR